MFLTRLIYASRISDACNAHDMEAILKVAQHFNKELGITGLLCFTGTYFIQCLEGPRQNLNSLYNRIARDPRHLNVTLLEYREVVERSFDQWSMAYAGSTAVDRQILLKHSAETHFDPFSMSGASAFAMLALLSQRLPPSGYLS